MRPQNESEGEAVKVRELIKTLTQSPMTMDRPIMISVNNLLYQVEVTSIPELTAAGEVMVIHVGEKVVW
jgi:hypothetical protein